MFRLCVQTKYYTTEVPQYICSCLDYVYSLLNATQQKFHNMFLRTYGIIYVKNADMFDEIFKDIQV